MNIKAITASTGTAEPIGMIVTGLVGILSVFGIFTMAGLGPDQVGQLLSFLGLLVTAGRTIWNAHKAVPPGYKPEQPPEQLPE